MPLMFGIFMSVMMTSKSALSSFLFAASPELTVSILWPSRRRAISSISQMERSSSQTRMLPMGSFPQGSCDRGALGRSGVRPRSGSGVGYGRGAARCCAPQAENEHATLSRFGPGPHLAFVGLHDLINNGQTEAGTAFELGLEGLENLLDNLRIHPGTGIGKIDLPVIPCRIERDAKGPATLHGADCVLAKIPEDLFDLVAVRQGEGFFDCIVPLDLNACLLRYQAIFEECESVLEQRQQVDFGELVLLAARVGQKVCDDAIQAFGLASDNTE